MQALPLRTGLNPPFTGNSYISNNIMTFYSVVKYGMLSRRQKERDCPKKTYYYKDTIRMRNILEDARVSIEKQNSNLLSLDTVNSLTTL
jgi:hypothetical protein